MSRARVAFSVLGASLLVVGWEIGATLVGRSSPNPSIVWPHLSEVLGRDLPAIATVDTTGGARLDAAARPGLAGAASVLADEAWVTIRRVVLGTAAGVTLGFVLGLLCSVARWFRLLFHPLLNTLRQVPLFAFTLLFLVWFGGTDAGIYVFVIYGTSLMMMVATTEAIQNVPAIHVHYARTLGAGRARTYRTVILPAIVPELASVALVATGLAWAMVMAAEFLGTQRGLGRMILFFQTFQLTGRMVVVALVITALAIASHLLLAALIARLTRWVPRAT